MRKLSLQLLENYNLHDVLQDIFFEECSQQKFEAAFVWHLPSIPTFYSNKSWWCLHRRRNTYSV